MNKHKAEENQNNASPETQVDENELKQDAGQTEESQPVMDEKEEKQEALPQEDDSEVAKFEEEISKLNTSLAESKDKFLRLFSEFENFRRRTAKERLDLIQTANEDLMQVLLPVLDDFRRAMVTFEKDQDPKSLNQGVTLIENKLRRSLEQKGLKAMDVKSGDDFNPEFHEAISQSPAPKKKLVGKIIDVIEDGYFLGTKVIRYAKVVIGS